MINSNYLLQVFRVSPIPGLIVCSDAPFFTIVEVNDAYLKATNTTYAALIDKGIFQVFPDNPDDKNANGVFNLRQSLLQVMHTGKPHKMPTQKYDIPIRDTNAFEEKYWEPENIPILDDNNKVEYVMHTVQDVTDKINQLKQLLPARVNLEALVNEQDISKAVLVKEQIEASEKKYRYLFDNNPSPMFIWDFETLQIIDCNQEALQKYGYTREEFLQLTLMDIRPKEDVAIVESLLNELKVSHNIYKKSLRHKKKNGDIIYVDINGHLIDYNGRRASLVHINDVTQKLKAQSALKNSEERYKLLFQFSPFPKWIYDLETYQILDVNETAIQQYGYLREEFLNMTIRDIQSPEEISIVKSTIENIGSHMGIIQFGIFNHYKKDLTVVKAEVTGYPLIYQDKPCIMLVCNDVTERENALQQLKDKEAQLLIAQKIAKLGYWYFDAARESLYWSDEVYTIWGISKNTVPVTYASFYNAIHPDDRELFANAYNTSVKYSSRLDVQHRIILPDGTVKWVHGKGKKIESSNGQDAIFEGTVQDITAQKLLSLSLEESNQRYNYVTQATSDAIWDWNLLLDEIYWGVGIQKLFGYTAEQLKADSNFWTKHVHPEDLERVSKKMNEIIYGDANKWNDEYRYKKANGEYAYVEDKGFLIRDEKGKAVRMVGAMQDITKHKAEEERLKLLELVVVNTNDAVTIAKMEPFENTRPCIVYVNEMFTKMTGYQQGEVIGKPPFLFEGHKSDKVELKRLDEAFHTQQAREITIIAYKKNGEEFWVNISVSPVTNEKGAVTHWIVVQRDVTEKIKTQEEIVKQKKFTEDILNNIPSDIAVFDSKHNYLFLNSIAVVDNEMREWMIGKNDFDYCKKKGLSDSMALHRNALFSRALKDKIVIDWIDEQQSKNGETRYILRKFSPYFENDELKYVIGYGTDITERKKAEIELIKVYEERDSILESIGDAFFAVDKNWVVTYWNHHAEKLLLKKKSEMLGHQLWQVFSASIGSLSYNMYHQAIETNQVIHFEDYYEGLSRHFEVSAYPSVNGLSVYFKDVTLRTQVEQRIKSERNLLRTLIDNLPDTIYFKDKSARKLISNCLDYKLLGAATEAEVLGKTDLEIFPDNLGQTFYQDDLEILKTGKPLINSEEYFIAENNKPLWLLTTKLPIRNELNEVIGLLGIGRDITERKIAEEKLKELNAELEKHVKQLVISNQELEQFAYVASHDLQEPLRMVTSFLTQIEKKYGGIIDDKGRQYIHFAVDGASRMRQIILDLLEFSRIGKAEDKLEEVNLAELINEISILCSKQIKTQKATIKTDPLPVLITFRSPVRQVFQNLISNSLKYQQEGVKAEIFISVKDKKKYWQFAVSDNGIGIDPQYFDRIFIIFQRLHNKSDYAGTGMGLAITKKIIENMGGKIWVESSEGKGAAFYFTIAKNTTETL